MDDDPTLDSFVHDLYGGAIRAQLQEPLLFGEPVVPAVPWPRWRRLLAEARDRLRGAYSVLRHGTRDAWDC